MKYNYASRKLIMELKINYSICSPNYIPILYFGWCKTIIKLKGQILTTKHHFLKMFHNEILVLIIIFFLLSWEAFYNDINHGCEHFDI